MGEEGVARIWGRLDELKQMLTRVLAVQDEREKNCKRHDVCISKLKDQVHDLELSRAEAKGKAMVLAVIASAITSVSVSVVAAVIVWYLKG